MHKFAVNGAEKLQKKIAVQKITMNDFWNTGQNIGNWSTGMKCILHEVNAQTEQGLTSHQTHYRSYRGRVLWVKWPNQQCQSTQGR